MARYSLFTTLFSLLFLFQTVAAAKPRYPNLFSDKTPYHFTPTKLNKPPQCQAVHINMVVRHGSRYPGTLHVIKMKNLLQNINKMFPANTSFSYKSLTLPWYLPSDVVNAASKEMSKLGSQEMYSIARRFLATFPKVFGHNYSNLNYRFIATDKLRSSQSAMAFAQGIFQGRGHLGQEGFQPISVKSSGPYDNDFTLRIFESCPKWRRILRKWQKKSEYNKFLNGPEMQRVIKNIKNRLKISRIPTDKKMTTEKAVVEMFLMCAFGVQTDSADGSWCDVFEEDDLKTMEYLQDLKLYWDRSYGRKINYRMGCGLYKEIIETIEAFILNNIPHGIFRFAHTGTIIPLFTMLGLYNDTVPPRADNFVQQANRRFRISNIVPMGANVAFVLYSCKGNKTKSNCKEMPNVAQCKAKHQLNHLKNFKIQILVNEAAVPIPGCSGRMYCNLDKFMSYYSHIRDNCDLQKICRTKLKCKNWFTKKGPTD